MTDLRSLADDDVIAMVEVSRGEAREELVSCLGWSTGDSGVPYLRSLLREGGRGSGHLRSAALNALTRRLGQGAGPELVSALSGGTLETQLTALMNLEDVDDGSAAGDVFGWLRRRLRHSGRGSTAGEYEIPCVLRYARRVGALSGLLALLDSDLGRLLPHEKDRLEQVWPRATRDRYRDTASRSDEPDSSALEAWYRISVFGSGEKYRAGPVTADEWQERAILRARRRLNQA